MKIVTRGSCAALLAIVMNGHGLDAATSCAGLSSLALPNTSITLAQMVPAGGFVLPGTAFWPGDCDAHGGKNALKQRRSGGSLCACHDMHGGPAF